MLSHVFKKNTAQPASGERARPHPGQPGGAGATLSISALEQLAPHGQLRAGYPHVWERIDSTIRR